MKKLYQFNKIIYRGNIDRDFFLFCCKKNKKLYVYILIHILISLLSLILLKAEIAKKKNYHKYLKKLNNIDMIIKEFKETHQKKINEWYIDQSSMNNTVFSTSPELIVKPFLKKEKLIAPKLNQNYEMDLISYTNQINKTSENYQESYYNTFKNVNLFKSKYIYVKKGFLFISYKNNKINFALKKLFRYLMPIFLSILLLLISFTFTTVYLDTIMIGNYLNDIKLLLLNLLPILLIILVLLFATKRLWISFSLTSILVFIIGIINKTKLYYRDDVFKIEDITLFKEALLMTSRYDIIIRWYTIVCILLCFLIILLLKKYYKKLNLKNRYSIPITILLLIISFFVYQKIYTNAETYNSVGNTENINIWIATRQSQIRGLIYPFIYSATEILDNEPVGYNEKEVEEILNEYTYDDIPEDKKVNVIAIMLEAYNDFSKFDSITFTDDVYEKLHEIEENSLHGNIVVDIFGGGTVSTERHFITGFYEFPSFRKETNSYARYFKEQGYIVEAMHPIYGAFYNRNTINANLGFDNYWNYENKFWSYNGWASFANDNELYSEIIKGLEEANANNEYYFNFSVTYQNHGPYESTSLIESYIENKDYSSETYNTINNYLRGIKDSNEALYELVEYLDNYDEPTILIFFGDHNPYLGEGTNAYEELGITMDLSTVDGFKNYYSIPYVIHANDNAKEIFDKDFTGELDTISPNYLMNELFEYIGYEGNEYLKYTSELKKQIEVINPIYYKEEGEYVSSSSSNYQNAIDEFIKVNYYWATNLRK